MAVTFGGASAGVPADFVFTATVSAFATSGSNRVGICFIGGFGDPTGVTWGGSPMTLLETHVLAGVRSSMYRIIDPPTSASDIVASFSVELVGAICAAYFNGVDQTT